jgi:hypothetical protein
MIRRHRTSRLAWHHAGMILRHIGNFDQFNIEDQIRFRGDPWMVRATIWNRMRSVSQLERDEETPLAAYLHATEALVKAGEWPSPAHAPALQKLEWLRFAQFWLAVGIFLGLPILIQHRRPTSRTLLRQPLAILCSAPYRACRALPRRRLRS